MRTNHSPPNERGRIDFVVTDPLVLTAEQTAIVVSAAAGLPPRWRTRFTELVIDSDVATALAQRCRYRRRNG